MERSNSRLNPHLRSYMNNLSSSHDENVHTGIFQKKCSCSVYCQYSCLFEVVTHMIHVAVSLSSINLVMQLALTLISVFCGQWMKLSVCHSHILVEILTLGPYHNTLMLMAAHVIDLLSKSDSCCVRAPFSTV